jgi:TRAP transporter TAXI family solute receptor
MSKSLFIGALALCGAATANAAQAAGNLPDTLVWTAYGTNTSGYAQSVAMGNMLKNTHGVTLTVKPGKNDVSRMLPLKMGKADYCTCGVTAYFATEGVGMFGTEKWGPQNMRLVLSAMGASGTGVATAAEANIATPADLRGKRIPWVRGADSLNVPMTAMLAFGGLTWDDVEKVEYSGFKDMWEALVNGQGDAAFATTVTPLAEQLAASPKGVHWLPLDHDDAEGWDRLTTFAPYFVKHTATVGAGISADTPWEGTAYPYPVLIGDTDRSADEVYALVKALDEGYDQYKDNAPGAKGWALSQQNLTWVIPYHDGAVRYFTDVGIWTNEAEAHNQALIKRQGVILGAWDTFMAGDTPSDEEAFKAAWLAQRAESLRAAGFEPVFE